MTVREDTKDAGACFTKDWTIKEISFWFNTKILIGTKLEFERTDFLSDIRAVCVLHETIVFFITINSSNFVLPKIPKEFIILFRNIDESVTSRKHYFICLASKEAHVSVSGILHGNRPFILNSIWHLKPVNTEPLFHATVFYQLSFESAKRYIIWGCINVNSEFSLTLRKYRKQ